MTTLAVPTPKIYGLTVRMNDREFEIISNFIERRVGIKLPPSKKVLVEGRLQKILRTFGFTSFTPYLEMAIGKHANQSETIRLIDSITTNKTDFYREADHFQHLEKHILRKAQENTSLPVFKVWSAACSSGEEVYTLAMVLNELKLKGIIPDFEITATDISRGILQKAINAEYHGSRVQPIPEVMKRKYMMRHKDRSKNQYRVVKTLRDRVKFGYFNLIESRWPDSRLFDVVFCRNVFIYFDRETQARVVHSLSNHLKSDGLLYLGHSETLHGMSVPVVPVATAVYKNTKKNTLLSV